jgi:hypothetical protein
VKKLISIGVALALLTLAVVPGAVAAQCDYDGITPTTYAKIPFTIIGSGFYLMETVLGALTTAGLLPPSVSWLPDLMQPMGDWAMGPLAWTVDMLGWGVSLIGDIMVAADSALTAMGIDLGGISLAGLQPLFGTVACSLFQPFSCNVTGAAFDPCA